MEPSSLNAKNQTTTAWIVVLAVAITCCAILFLVFANYLAAINRNLASANTQLALLQTDESRLLEEVQSLHRAVTAAAPVTANPAKVVPPTQTAPAGAAPAAKPAPNPATKPAAKALDGPPPGNQATQKPESKK